MRILSFLATFCITLPLTLFALSFALSNPLPVGLSLWPLTFVAQPAVSLGVVGVVLLFGGFLAGAMFVSVFAQRWRFRAWQLSRRAARLETDLQAAEAKVKELEALQAPAPERQAPARLGTQAALRDAESTPFRFY